MKFKRNDKRKVRAAVELTPLIDVVFLLLIFFMLSSTFVVQTSIPIEIPESVGAEQFEQKDLSITLAYGTTHTVQHLVKMLIVHKTTVHYTVLR